MSRSSPRSIPPDRLSARLHRGARPQDRELPEWVVPLGRTFGFPANGAVSNLAMTPAAVSRLRTELAIGRYDVVHLHEPHAPIDRLGRAHAADAPLVGTFHCYSRNRLTNNAGNVAGAWRRPEPAARPHRRVRGRGLDRAPLLRRALPRDPQRGARASTVAATAPQAARGPAAARLRRPGGRAQGPAGAAARLRGAARAPARASCEIVGATHDEIDGVLLDDRGVRRARQGLRRAQAPGAARGGPAVRAVARRRVVRHGADRGLRRGHARRRLGHRRLLATS